MRYKRKFLNWVQHFQFHSVTVITNLSYLCIVFQYSLIPCDKVCKMYFFYIRSHFFKEAHSRSKEHRLSCIDIRCGPFFISSCIIPLLRCSRETIRLKASKQILRFVFFFFISFWVCVRNFRLRKVLVSTYGLCRGDLSIDCHDLYSALSALFIHCWLLYAFKCTSATPGTSGAV